MLITAAPASSERRFITASSGVTRRSEISQPRRLLMCILTPPLPNQPYTGRHIAGCNRIDEIKASTSRRKMSQEPAHAPRPVSAGSFVSGPDAAGTAGQSDPRVGRAGDLDQAG